MHLLLNTPEGSDRECEDTEWCECQSCGPYWISDAAKCVEQEVKDHRSGTRHRNNIVLDQETEADLGNTIRSGIARQPGNEPGDKDKVQQT